MRLSRKQKQILTDMADGHVLKAHRDINGRKKIRLHHPDDHERFEGIPRPIVDALKDAGLLASNQKFPAATYFLTERGRTVTQELTGEEVRAMGPIRFLSNLFKADEDNGSEKP